MKNNVEPGLLSQLDAVFAQLHPQAVEEFYAAYQQWNLQQRITELRQRIGTVREQQADNKQRMQQAQPSPIELAALARLQSNGVSDIELLDAMLERGETWLDQTMQRLNYCEQFDDFISDDYTQWCRRALEGAFDWIDSLREATGQEAPTPLETLLEEAPSDNEDAGDVEALLLQRLATEDDQDDLSWQEEITLKQTAIKLPPQETGIAAPVEPEPEPAELVEAARHDAETQNSEYLPQDESERSDETLIESNIAAPTSAEEYITPEEALPVEDTAISEPKQPALVEFAPIGEPAVGEEELLSEDEQPALVEFAPRGEIVTDEDAPDNQDEQPTLIESTAPSELSATEETLDQVSEQPAPAEIAMPEDLLIPEDTASGAVNEPVEIDNSASEEAAPHEEQAVPTSETIAPARSVQNVPRKRGLIQSLIWILFGK
jgi:hypothetical protein